MQPTKNRVSPKAVTLTPLFGPVERSKLVEEDAEAAKAKAREEQMEESQPQRMSGFDTPQEIEKWSLVMDVCLKRNPQAQLRWHMFQHLF